MVLLTVHEALALKALRDCRVIKAAVHHPGYRGLVHHGYAFGQLVEKVPETPKAYRHFRLTPAGELRARALPVRQ